jgi:hypothetical protein
LLPSSGLTIAPPYPVAKGNFSSQGVGFRVRILQKSHMTHNRMDEPLYACHFCIASGRTTDESDATVFFSHSQLFAHMARHARPLPPARGLIVIDGETMPQQHADNYDLWFGNPSLASVMAGIRRETAKMPSGVAIETRKNANGIMRTPPDRSPALQFASGARIVGIEYPSRYAGKWGVGWHDGVRGAFEAESVNLEAPPAGELRVQGSHNNMQAVVAWKFKQAGEGSWLKLAKGDVVKNIGWAYDDHWCWSGTTPKGWGIFPASHVDPASVRSMDGGDDKSSMTSSEKRKNSALSMFSIRKTSTSKGSAAVSANSKSCSLHPSTSRTKVLLTHQLDLSVSGNGSLMTRRQTNEIA